MSSSSAHLSRPILAARMLAAVITLGSISSVVHAESQVAIPQRSVAVSVQGDQADSHDATATFVLPINQSLWTQLVAGSTRASLDDGSATTRMAGAGIGVQTGSFQSQLSFAYREDNDALTLQDFSGAVTYFASQGSVGVDVFHRRAKDETTVSRTARFRNPRSAVITSSSDGWGFGLHGDFNLTDRWSVFAAGMKYNYQNASDHATALRIERLEVSGVTRDTALLDNTASVGATLKLQPVQLTLSYIRDRAADTDDLTQTAELSANIPIGNHWMIAPRIGYSSSKADQDIGYAGVSVQLNW
jgi:hypothetical protein